MEKLLESADIKVNGSRPWDIQVHNNGLFHRVARAGSLGLGEAYVDGWWDAAALDETFHRALRADLDAKIGFSWAVVWSYLKAVLLNLQSPVRSFEVGRHHYDIGNDVYRAMLDGRLTYTCGYWHDATTLEQAQEAKLELVCKKIGLKAGDTVLDIGCGWGSFAQFAAQKYGAIVTGVTVSKEQIALGKQRCAGLPVDLRFEDYRNITGTFDHIVSLGMFEHVGVKNYGEYMRTVAEHLNDGGLFLLHTIGGNRSVRTTDPWIGTYIFPNSMLPSAAQIVDASEEIFVLEDWHSFGADYDRTLMAWHQNFVDHWDQLKGTYDERFYRMWTYYLLSCAGSFRARRNQLWQIVFSKHGVPGGYASSR